MDFLAGLVANLSRFLYFLPFFVLLLALGLLKAVIIGPVALCIILLGNSAVVIGLWIAHFVWTYYCVARTRRLGWVLKMLALVLLPIPLVIWPVIGIVGSLLGGIGYGFFAPLIATFEAVGENVRDKFHHCFVDGCWPTIEGSCTAVRDFTDFCFHSYFSYMDELRENAAADELPMDIKITKLPGCLLVSLIAVPVDMVLITAVAIWRSPYMLYKGWKRLFEDLVGREGPFLEAECVPFAGLAIILWPLAVVGAVVASILSSFFLGLYSGVVAHQEGFKLGLAYIASVISLFDEYVNDLLFLREGSCLPRPKYRKNMKQRHRRNKSLDNESNHFQNRRDSTLNSKLVSERSRTLKEVIQHYKPVQVWDWLFKSCEVNGRILLRDGLVEIKDVEECFVKGDCKKLGIKLPAWSILQCLLTSAKSDSSGLVISDDVELTRTNGPEDKVFEWFIGPLLIIKEQIRELKLDANEEICLRRLVMQCKNEKPEDWDDIGFPSDDPVRRAQLQAIIRRLLGIVASMSRMPTFRRRFRNLVKILYMEALEAGASGNHIGEIIKYKHSGRESTGCSNVSVEDEAADRTDQRTCGHVDIV